MSQVDDRRKKRCHLSGFTDSTGQPTERRLGKLGLGHSNFLLHYSPSSVTAVAEKAVPELLSYDLLFTQTD